MSETLDRSTSELSEDHRFPCDNCGADFRYAPAEGALVCDHCGNRAELEDDDGNTPGRDPWSRSGGAAIPELDFERALRDQLPAAEMEETRVSNCPNCGAQVEFSPDIHAAECPFCATPVVTDTGTHRHIKPAGLVPFQITEREAKSSMTRWLGRLWFAPSGLEEYARKGRKLSGIYVPFWTYDADTASRYRGQRGTVYYVTTRGSDGKSRRQAKVRWRRVQGRVARFFDDVLVLGSRSLPKRYTDALAPWSLGALTAYEPEYLAGFRAEGYTVDLDQGMAEARAIMDARIAQDVRRDIGGDRQRIESVDTRLSEVTFKHILLPVWLAAYQYRGKSYRFVVNGQTGKVQGERPYSAIKIALAVLAALIVLGGLAALYAWQEGAFAGGFSGSFEAGGLSIGISPSGSK
ncbi:MAG: TFIIB-type zinc finger domain-containing protein [Pseudomonadota bacterium]